MNRFWRWTPWIALAVIAVALLAVGSHRSSHPTLDAQVMHIASEVRCPVCDGETAAQSSAAASVQIRTQIRQELQAGQSSDQILAGLVRDYGPGILEKPQSSGVGLIVWVVPVVATVLATAALVFAFLRWQRRTRSAGVPDEPASGWSEAPTGTGAERPGTAGAGPVASVVSAVPMVERGGPEPVRVPAMMSVDQSASLDEALAAVVVPAVAVATVQSSGSSGSLSSVPDRPAPASIEMGGAGGDRGAQAPASAASPEAPDPRLSLRSGQRWLRGILIGTGVCLIAAGAGWAVAASSATRLPGQTITGQALGSQAVAEDMQAAQADAAKGNAVAAIKEYQKILQTDPTEVDALTAEGWLLVQTAEPSLLQQGILLLASAEKSDPSYAPAHLYRGLALLGEDDYSDSVPEFQWYLAHSPDPSVVAQVRQDLKQAQAGAKAEPSSANRS